MFSARKPVVTETRDSAGQDPFRKNGSSPPPQPLGVSPRLCTRANRKPTRSGGQQTPDCDRHRNGPITLPRGIVDHGGSNSTSIA